MPATVIHCRDAAGYPADQYVYCGRPSKWGNPFGHVHGVIIVRNRAEAIDRFREYFYSASGEHLRRAAPRELTDKVLGCWCVPKPCHVQIIADYVNQYAAAHQAPGL
jgi:hypothetical protein